MHAKTFMRKLLLSIFLLVSIQSMAQLNIDHFMRVGRTRVQIGNYVGAIESFNIVIKFKPYLPEPYFFRGIAKHNLEDFRGSVEDYNKAIEIKPYYPEAYMNRGLAYLSLQEYEKCITDYDKAVELDPRNEAVFNNRGIAKMSMKNIDGAIADYDKAIELNPKFTNAYINRSNAKILKNDIREAIRDLNKAIVIRPHFASAYLLRGLARFGLDDYAAALRDFDQCIKLDSKNAYAFNNRGIVKQKLEDYQGAIMDYDFAIYLDPTMANAYMNRGVAKEVLGMEGFNQDYTIAGKLDPKFAIAQQDLDASKFAQNQQQQQQQGSASSNQSGTQSSNKNQQQASNQQSANKQVADQQSANKQQSSPAETKEQRDRRRFKLSLADTRNLPDMSDEEADDGRIQNKNVIIELQPVFILSAYDNSSAEFSESRYYNLALEELNSANNYNPTIMLTNRPTSYFQETFENYVRYFDEKIKINNSLSGNYLSRGIFFGLTKDFQPASDDFNKAISLDKENLLAYFSRANYRVKMAELIESLNDPSEELKLPIQGVIEDQSKDLILDDYKDVIDDYQICLQLNPKFPFAYFNRAYVKCKLKEYESAEIDLNEAIRLEPDFAEAWFNRGLIRIYLDDVDGGAADLSKAGELGIQEAYNVIKRYCN